MTGATKAILVVEDETVLRSSMVGGLGKLPGVSVVAASTLREAIALLDMKPPDIVVSDIDLPDGLGVQLIGEIAKRQLIAPIVFVTAYRAAYGTLIPPHAGVEVLEKPFALETLRSTVLRLLGGEPISSPFTVADYVQLSCMGRHSVVIDARGAFGAGRVEILQGEIWSATDAEGSGNAAFRRLAFRRDARIVCNAVEEDPGERNIFDSWEGVLMEAARLHDEENRPPDAAPADAEVDFDFGDVTMPSRLAPTAPPAVTVPAEPDEAFGVAYDQAIAALMLKDYAGALSALHRAHELRPDDAAVNANLKRLAEMGHGEEPKE